MKTTLARSFCIFALAISTNFAHAGQAPTTAPKQLTGTTDPAVNPVALQKFVDHAGFCEIFLGKNTEVDALVMEYSKELADALPSLGSGDDSGNKSVDLAMATIKSACNAKSLASRN